MSKGYDSNMDKWIARAKEDAAESTIEAVKAQRAAHDAYCEALESKIASLEKQVSDMNGAHMLVYTFFADHGREQADRFARHCLECGVDEWRAGIPLALDGLEEYSKTASEWFDEYHGRKSQ